MSKRPRLLEEIIELAIKERAAGRPLKAIFDLDSTLFDVSPRISEIFHAFAAKPEMKIRFPKETDFLAGIKPHVGDYGVKRTLERCGFKLEDTTREFIGILVEYWKKQFFGNDYLKFDRPYPGAQDFVTDLCDAGAEIYYLTGRDVPRMHRGSVEALRKFGFPLGPNFENLILKPTTGEKDSAFKKRFFEEMDRSEGEVWFFENEPKNVRLVIESCPHIKVVFVDTVHSEAAPLPGSEIPRISGFEE